MGEAGRLRGSRGGGEEGISQWWFHCNICSAKPVVDGSRSSEFLLSDCDHIFCKDCVDRFQKEPDFCPVCKQKVILRNVKELPEAQRFLFEPPARLMEPILLSHNLACKQSELLVRHLNAKIKTLQQEIQNNDARAEIVREELAAIEQRKAKDRKLMQIGYGIERKDACQDNFLQLLTNYSNGTKDSALAPISGLFFDTTLNNTNNVTFGGSPGPANVTFDPFPKKRTPFGH